MGKARADKKIPAGLRSSSIVVGDRTLLVMSYPIPVDDVSPGNGGSSGKVDTATDAMALLTPTEREVVRALLSGLSNAEIANARRRSVYTINKQIESAYRKLGVGSRAELSTRLARHR